MSRTEGPGDRWLALEGQLGRDPRRPATEESATTAPGARPRRPAPVHAPRDEDVDDPATVLMSSRRLHPMLAELEEDVEDARTVRVARMPLAFIGESVTDPTTTTDTSEAAARWRESGELDEIDLLTDPYSIDPTPPKGTAPPLAAVEDRFVGVQADEPALSSIVVSLLLGAVLGVGAVAAAVFLLF
jgi:hypothetical protein